MGLVRISVALVLILVYLFPGVGYSISEFGSRGQPIELVGSYDGVSLGKLTLQAGYLFAAGGDEARLYIFKLTDPTVPVLLVTEDLPEHVRDIEASGEWPRISLYLISKSGLSIYEFDLESENLSKAGYYDLLDYPLHICVRGFYAYIADDIGGLKVIDVSDASKPYEVGCYKNAGAITEVYVSGCYAFVSGWLGIGHSFIIIDISDPRNPYEVGHCDLGEMDGVGAISVSGSYAFLLCNGPMLGDWYVSIIDISDVTKPVQVKDFFAGLLADLAVIDDYLFTCTSSELQIFDVSDIAKPHTVARYLGDFLAIRVSRSYAYIAGRFGLQILHWEGLLEPAIMTQSTWGWIKARFK